MPNGWCLVCIGDLGDAVESVIDGSYHTNTRYPDTNLSKLQKLLANALYCVKGPEPKPCPFCTAELTVREISMEGCQSNWQLVHHCKILGPIWVQSTTQEELITK